MKDLKETAKLNLSGGEYDLPVYEGSVGNRAMDITKLFKETGCITLDPGYANTGSTTSSVTFVDGEKGILRYRGYPVEDLAKQCDFTETAYLIIHGELPTEEQLEWNEKAMELAESSSNDRARKWLGALYNNIGWTYHDQEEYEKALELFEKALAWRQEQGQETEIRIAKWCVARALRSLERTEEALTMQEALLAEFSEAGETDGYVFEELGECHFELGDAEEAADLDRALNDLRRERERNEREDRP